MFNTAITRFGQAIADAIGAGVSPEIVAVIASTSHAGRLDTLFNETACRFLRAHTDAKQHRTRYFEAKARAAKALLDLVRARQYAIGSSRPSLDDIVERLDRRTHLKLVHHRQAA